MKARKELGQHFLRDRDLLTRIADASTAGPREVILEIGPGPGGLTAALLDTGATVVAIEMDTRMGAELVRRHATQPFALIEGDALQLPWDELVRPWTAMGFPWRVVGNIPYYITSPLLERALTPPLPASVTFLVQEEVARRLVAEPGTSAYGALTVGITAVADVTSPMRIGRGSFVPPPKVDSAVVHLVPRAEPLVEGERVAELRRLVVSLFSYRRKRMQRALREARGLGAEEAGAALDAAGIDPDVRPEVLTPEDFVRLLGVVGDSVV
ncbi:MAG TPA: 16S rRNA (adenine(1518)-N(6)/adenine(1519)-N(6))-dimethyltransferase RsmA [Gemmatimonadales bacterium]|nr:16S rRNA (adenine(1518)-N(6)/adenine(1519)-N(6))-dimethyltransferase RsmA [Gemmatimonadales bacterium]